VGARFEGYNALVRLVVTGVPVILLLRRDSHGELLDSLLALVEGYGDPGLRTAMARGDADAARERFAAALPRLGAALAEALDRLGRGIDAQECVDRAGDEL
jgi:hypothetical protein